MCLPDDVQYAYVPEPGTSGNSGKQKLHGSCMQIGYCWWFRNPKQPPGMVLKPCKSCDKLPINWLEFIRRTNAIYEASSLQRTFLDESSWLKESDYLADLRKRLRSAKLFAPVRNLIGNYHFVLFESLIPKVGYHQFLIGNMIYRVFRFLGAGFIFLIFTPKIGEDSHFN